MPDSRPLAMVAGASSGIGRELGRQFAADGFGVVVAAEDGELAPAAGELAASGADVQAVRTGLSTAPQRFVRSQSASK